MAARTIMTAVLDTFALLHAAISASPPPGAPRASAATVNPVAIEGDESPRGDGQ
jgi:hypothetical protein